MRIIAIIIYSITPNKRNFQVVRLAKNVKDFCSFRMQEAINNKSELTHVIFNNYFNILNLVVR
jgi:hypothetical protein